MADPAIRVDNLVKVYGRGPSQKRAVDGLSFTVDRGSIFGLLGPNGAGKTTTLRILTTLARPTSGRAELLGYDVVGMPLEVRKRIGVVVQEQAADLFLSVRDNLLTFARFHGCAVREIRDRVADVIVRFGLESIADQKMQDLSGGTRRRVQVAKMFVVDIPVIFLDEFSSGMDAALRREVMDLIRGHAREGRTIVLTTHVLSEAEALCDDILILDRGRQIARGSVQALKQLTKRRYEVRLSFDRVPEDLHSIAAGYRPVQLETSGNSVTMKIQDDESRVLELVTTLSRRAHVQQVEITGASLEDVFLELTARKEAER